MKHVYCYIREVLYKELKSKKRERVSKQNVHTYVKEHIIIYLQNIIIKEITVNCRGF